MMRTCLPSTFMLTPVIQESTSLERRPSPALFLDEARPLVHRLSPGVSDAQTALVHVAEQVADPFHVVFDAARDVAERGVRAHHHEHVREAIDHHADEGGGPTLPLVLQSLPASPSDIDAVEAAGDGVEAGCVDDDVELELPVAGLQTSPGDPLDRG